MYSPEFPCVVDGGVLLLVHIRTVKSRSSVVLNSSAVVSLWLLCSRIPCKSWLLVGSLPIYCFLLLDHAGRISS